MRLPRPVLFSDSATSTASTISQMSGLAKPLSASVKAAAGLPGLVLWVWGMKARATTDSEPIGIALRMIATIVPMNSANRCQALGETLAGTGMTNQIRSARPTAMAVGTSLGNAGLVVPPPVRRGPSSPLGETATGAERGSNVTELMSLALDDDRKPHVQGDLLHPTAGGVEKAYARVDERSEGGQSKARFSPRSYGFLQGAERPEPRSSPPLTCPRGAPASLSRGIPP